MKFAEGPECDPKAGQKSGKNSEPGKRKCPTDGLATDIAIMSLTNNVEPKKADETGLTSGTAEDLSAQQER